MGTTIADIPGEKSREGDFDPVVRVQAFRPDPTGAFLAYGPNTPLILLKE